MNILPKHIKDLSIQRKWQEALIYYILFILAAGIGVVVLVILSFMFGVEMSDATAYNLGVVTAIIFTTALSFYLINIKNYSSNGSMLFLGVSAVALTYLFGIFVGLILPCYIMTKTND